MCVCVVDGERGGEFAFGWIGCCWKPELGRERSTVASTARSALSSLAVDLLYIEMVGCKLFFEAEREREAENVFLLNKHSCRGKSGDVRQPAACLIQVNCEII